MRLNTSLLVVLCISFLFVIEERGFAEEKLPYLHSINIENKISESSRPDLVTTISLFTKNPDRLQQQFHNAQTNIFKDRIDVEYPHYIPTPVKEGNSYLNPTFLIDYDEAVFQHIKQEVIKVIGTSVDAEKLSDYTFHFLKKTMDRLYDAASIVAVQKQGDCSEHAVFLTAILRKFKIPAKTVHGIVLRFSRENRQWKAFGHAWVEYYENESWQGIDPTFNQKVGNTYIPNFAIEREDMSSSYYILNQEASYGIEKVSIY